MAAKKPKIDPAHEETERIIAEMEKKISKEYAQAEKEVQAKLDDYLRRFRLKDEKWREWVANGTKTEAEYRQWRIGQLAVGKRWESLKQTIAEDYVNADKIARSIVKGYMPEVYAENFNYGTYEVEVGAKVNTSFTLYDRQTVERIIRDNPDLLPAPGKKVSQQIAEGKAIRWNRQKVQSVMLQGILQGESISKLATRLAKEVGDSDRKAAIRNARTMATGAQNAGRIDSYKRAEAMGIDMEQEWRATLDMRTRHEHRMLDGQRQKVGDPFEVDGYKIMFPGDPSAEGFLIYNCRCTLRGVVAGLEPQARKYRDESAIEGLTYDEWKAQKKSKSNSITLPEEKGEAIAEKFRREYRDGVFGGKSGQPKAEPKPQNTYGNAATVQEAVSQAENLGCTYARMDSWTLERANNAVEALATLPEDCRPRAILDGKDTELITGRKLGRKADSWYGVTYDYRNFSFRTMYLGYDETDYEGGQIVGLNVKSFKDLAKLTKTKQANNEKYFEKTGRYWFFNTDGKATAFHEMGHCFYHVRVDDGYNDINKKVDNWKTLAEKWYNESKCDILQQPEEAFAEAWAAYHVGDDRLPDYIKKAIEDLL